jgi:hypothetical protein
MIGELVGDQQTNTHAQRDAITGDQDQLGDCENSFFHKQAPRSSDAGAVEVIFKTSLIERMRLDRTRRGLFLQRN